MTSKEVKSLTRHANKCGGKDFNRHYEKDLGLEGHSAAIYKCRKCKKTIRVPLRRKNSAAQLTGRPI